MIQRIMYIFTHTEIFALFQFVPVCSDIMNN
nr:MAG TPA: hypothetical protein [Caudoviricetes sp.]